MKAAGTRQYNLHSWLQKSFRFHIARCETFKLSIQQSALPIQKAYRSSYNITADEIHLWAHTSPISVHLHLNNFNCFIYFLTELFVSSQSWQRQSIKLLWCAPLTGSALDIFHWMWTLSWSHKIVFSLCDYAIFIFLFLFVSFCTWNCHSTADYFLRRRRREFTLRWGLHYSAGCTWE